MNFLWAIFLSVENLYVHEAIHVALMEWEWETGEVTLFLRGWHVRFTVEGCLHAFYVELGSSWTFGSWTVVEEVVVLTKTATERASFHWQGSSHSSARSMTQGEACRNFWTCTHRWTRWGFMQPDFEQFVVSLPSEN